MSPSPTGSRVSFDSVSGKVIKSALSDYLLVEMRTVFDPIFTVGFVTVAYK
jgi:hypothetical protein